MSLPREDDHPALGASAASGSASSSLSASARGADEIAAAVSAAPGVAALSGGRLGGVGTYLPGRRVTGVVIRDEDLEVHVVGRYGVPVARIAADVRRAVEPYAAERTVHVVIEDLA
jgi:hypothetical protein